MRPATHTDRAARQRLLTLLPAAIIAVALAAPQPATARGVVKDADLPGITLVAKQFPTLRGGARHVMNGYQLSVLGADCISYENAPTNARTGRFSNYTTHTGATLYFQGKADPAVYVYQYRTTALAAAAVEEQRAATERCYGRHQDGDIGDDYRPLTIPALGQDRFAFRNIGFDSVMGRDYSLEAWALVGNRVVRVRVQKDPSAPPAKPGIALLRTAIQKVS